MKLFSACIGVVFNYADNKCWMKVAMPLKTLYMANLLSAMLKW